MTLPWNTHPAVNEVVTNASKDQMKAGTFPALCSFEKGFE